MAFCLMPPEIHSHDQTAHELCINANDYIGCITQNKNFTYTEKAAAAGVLSALLCMERRNLIDQNESQKALDYALRELNIPIEIKNDSQVIKLAERISYLYQVDCRTKKDTDQIKMQKILQNELIK